MAKPVTAPSPAPERLELAEARANVIAARAAVQKLQSVADTFWERKRDARLEVEAAEAGIAEAQKRHVADLVLEAQGFGKAVPTMPAAKARHQAAVEARDAELAAEAAIHGALNSANYDLHRAQERHAAAEYAVLLPSLGTVLAEYVAARAVFQDAAAQLAVLYPLVGKRRRSTWPSAIEDAVRDALNGRVDIPCHRGESAFDNAVAKWNGAVEALAADPFAQVPR